MPSTKNDSSGTASSATPRSTVPENPCLAALIAESDTAAARLLAFTDWAAHDAALAQLAAESDAAAHHLYLLHQQDIEHAATVVSSSQVIPEDHTT